MAETKWNKYILQDFAKGLVWYRRVDEMWAIANGVTMYHLSYKKKNILSKL